MSLIRNERLKLFATYLNGLAIAIFALGGLAPLFSFLYGSSQNASAGFVGLVGGICFFVSGALHLVGSFVLKGLR